MEIRKYLPAVLVLLTVQISEGKLALLKNCCAIGTNHSAQGLACRDYKLPSIQKSDEKFCLNSLDVCCKNQYREKQCALGRDDAKEGNDCVSSVDTTSGDFRKECCSSCQFGIEMGSSGEPCENTLGLGPPYDNAFISCCEEVTKPQPQSRPPARTDFQTTTRATPPIPTTEPDINAPPLGNICDTLPDVCEQICLPNADSYKCACKDGYTLMSDGISCKMNKKISVLRPKGNICDFPDVCAQICIPNGDSYECACNDGYTLMSDGISCKINQKPSQTTQPTAPANRCDYNNPCEHKCTDTGMSVQCSCFNGYELAKNKVNCLDIDECLTGAHQCETSETCVNEEGTYVCESVDDTEYEDDFETRCPSGFIFNADKKVCDDVDECEFSLVCDKNTQRCENSQGSYRCVDVEEAPKCPPGFYFKDSIQDCQDIDECINGQHDCNRESQMCLNTKGNFTCVDKTVQGGCPPGFKKNSVTLVCEDINECLENKHGCSAHEDCVNESGGHTCEPRIIKYNQNAKPIRPTIPDSTTPKTVIIKPSPRTTTSTSTSTSTTTTTTTTTSTTTPPPRPPEIIRVPAPERPPVYHHSRPYVPVSCPAGLKYSDVQHSCVDVNECQTDNECDSNQDCINTYGSYVCNCKQGFEKDYTGACADVNECQLGSHDCSDGQRCDNTIGSYVCARVTGCGTGYTLNYASGVCEDDDECKLGTHTCGQLGPQFQCKNTHGSYRCERIPLPKFKPTPAYARPISYPTRLPFPTRPTPGPPLVSQRKTCLKGYVMNSQGDCDDIDECTSNPCGRGQRCQNLNGGYQCISVVQCSLGFEMNENGTGCVDIDECARGLHKCSSTQICKNAQGYYTCECPPGHKLNHNLHCEDIDECLNYRPCSPSADCLNTIGSFECRCKDGMKPLGKNNCVDVDECVEQTGLCQHKCVNLWGGYRCSCEKGYTLNPDNRTCSDIDECSKFKDQLLCVATCENTPGSYVCNCPRGYRLGTDGRTCQDIDECQEDPCKLSDEICINMRGGHRCHRIVCPPNYVRDPEHKSRCKKESNACDPRDQYCLQLPQQYSYHFVNIMSNLPIVNGHVDFFQMRGPTWALASVSFSMKIVNVLCPSGVKKADESYFRMNKFSRRAMLSIVKSIEGPQDIELQLEMNMYYNNIFNSKTIARIFLFVSEHNF